MQKITPHLWFDKEAGEAAELYAAAFGGGVRYTAELHGTPSGTAQVFGLELGGQEFLLLNAGPAFRFNPAVSFMAACGSAAEVDAAWELLSTGGKALMPLDKYPFADRYGWVQDKYGLSWQLIYAAGRPPAQRITPTLMFTGQVCGKAEEAVDFYSSVFSEARTGDILRYGSGEAPDAEGTVKHAAFVLEGQGFAAMDSARVHGFGFNEAVSFIVYCDTQEEIDHYWDRLSAVPGAEQCGWLKDKYGLSWQIVPSVMETMMRSGDERRMARATEAFLKMKKFDIGALKAAFEGR